MTKRKYSFEPLTDDELTALAKKYPEAVETRTVTIRKPVYRVIAMLIQCKVEGIESLIRLRPVTEETGFIDDAPVETPAFLHKKPQD